MLTSKNPTRRSAFRRLLVALSSQLAPCSDRTSLSHRTLHLESLERREVFDSGWASSMQSGLVSSLAGDDVGNTYLAGTFFDTATFGSFTLPGNGARDVFVAKVNPSGQFLWAVRAGNPTSGNDWNTGIAVDAAGDVVVSGWFDGTGQFGSHSITSAGDSDLFVAKLNGATGQFLWARQEGGAATDRGGNVEIDPTGNIVLSGELNQPTERAIFVGKYTPLGAEMWTRTTANNLSGLNLTSLAVDAYGSIYTGGRFVGTADFPTGTLVSTGYLPATGGVNPDGFIAKLDQAGNWAWARQFTGDTQSWVKGITIGSEGQLYLSGQFEGTTNFDSTSLTSVGVTDGFIARLDPTTAQVDWVRRFGGADVDSIANRVKVDQQGNINAVGNFRGTADFGPQTIVADGLENAYLTKLDPSGTFLETHRFVSGTYQPASNSNISVIEAGLNIDAVGNVSIGGWFSGGTVQFPQRPLSGSNGVGYLVKLPPASPTKFFVVDDAIRDRTYQYANGGNLTPDNQTLSTVNTTPRGAASTAAGDKLWVVDANKQVYVYNTSGGLLGSWTAGSLPSNANVQGVTTNGTDVWIVDATSDKVYRYINAANRTSGSQNAASSFNLNTSNKDATDLVTDGTTIWVLNNTSKTDKVFKYTVGGSLLGSWTISGGGGNPTGLTIDPSNVSNIWIVDNATDRVYQFDAAASRTSGSASPNSSFVLAAGNTNPQGIADPPPPAAFGSMGKTSDLQSPFVGVAPMPLFSRASSNVSSVTLQQVPSVVRTTDEFMRVLGLAFEQPKASVSVGRSTDVASTKSIDRNAGIDAEIQDHDIDDLIGLVAHDLWR